MALTSLVSIVQSPAKESLGQETENQQGAQVSGISTNSGISTLIQDSFTPSNPDNSPQSAVQEAGLFQVSPLALAAAAAGTLAQQTTQPQTNINPTPAPATRAAASNVDTTLPIPAANLNGLATATPPASAAVQTAPPANTQGQILAFNQALVALGLTNNDIQKLDQIATLVNDFSPTAFNDVIGQFQALARQAAQQSAANISSGPYSSSGGYQVQGLSIQFNGAQPSSNAAALTGGPQGATNGLLLRGVQFTLANAAGQTANVRAPQQKSGAAAAV
ncbi:MAG: hypothetical protein LAO08_15320 [Acidobacteriia bacterium]|nr:hypothetical protein [Terriglobia bacterium]